MLQSMGVPTSYQRGPGSITDCLCSTKNAVLEMIFSDIRASSGALPRARAALGKPSGGPHRDAHPAEAACEQRCLASDSWSRLSPPTSEAKKAFTPRSLEKLSKAGFFSRPSFLDMADHCVLGKGKTSLQLQQCVPHILEPRSCKI